MLRDFFSSALQWPRDLKKLGNSGDRYTLMRGAFVPRKGDKDDFRFVYGIYMPYPKTLWPNGDVGLVFEYEELVALAKLLNDGIASGAICPGCSEDDYKAGCKARENQLREGNRVVGYHF